MSERLSERARSARVGWIASLAIVCAATVGPHLARADVVAECELFEISAKTGTSASIDAELKPVEKKLKNPPFSTWNQFKLLSHAHKSLAKKKVESIPLKLGSATATLVEIVDKSKVRLTITMDDDKGKQVASNTTTVEAGDYVMFVHSLSKTDAHLLSVTCR